MAARSLMRQAKLTNLFSGELLMSNGDLICRSHVKGYILRMAKVIRPGWTCRRVSGQALDQINAKVRTMINDMIRSHPTVGQTFKP